MVFSLPKKVLPYGWNFTSPKESKACALIVSLFITFSHPELVEGSASGM